MTAKTRFLTCLFIVVSTVSPLAAAKTESLSPKKVVDNNANTQKVADFDEKITTLSKLVAKQQKVIIQQQGQLTLMSQQIQQINKTCQGRTGRDKNVMVPKSGQDKKSSKPNVFSVTLTEQLRDTGLFQVLKFNSMDLNAEKAYNRNTGLFKCSKFGVYMFMYTGGGNVDPSGQIWLQLKTGQTRKKGTLYHNTDVLIAAGTHIVTQMNRGDTAWVEGDYSPKHDDDEWSSRAPRFSGFQLY